MSKRWQKNLTIPNEQVIFIKENHSKMPVTVMAKHLKLSYNKIHNNLRLLGMVNYRTVHQRDLTHEGYFNIDEFAKHYTY